MRTTTNRLSRKVPSRLLAAVALAVMAALVIPRTTYADGSGGAGWELVRQDDGILVSRKEVSGSPFLALRGEGDVDEPLLLVGSVLVDVLDSREWVDSVSDARVLRWVGATEYVAYTHVGTPIAMSDRDFVTDVKVDVDPAAEQLVIRIHSVADPAAPESGYVRGEIRESTMVLTSQRGGRSTHVVAELHADPKGGVAAWMVNLFQKNWGYNTLEGLRARAAKPETRVVPWLRTLLTDSGFFSPTSSTVAASR
jgi:hypothetical protein